MNRNTPPARRKTFRRDIEGLRALAVGLVLAYHSNGVVPGGFIGVDIFFVISGFLITSLLLRNYHTYGRIQWDAFYAGRVKRLLPAALAVLVFAGGLVAWVGPSLQRAVFGGDIAAAAGFVVNWRFADRAVDYLAEDLDPSPVLHFWSLSIEEQFYLIWPLILIGAGLLARRRGYSFEKVAMWSVATVFVLSLTWSFYLTDADAAYAFFVTPTRVWELALGALIATTAAWWKIRAVKAQNLLAITALGAIVASALLFDSVTAWPGLVALIPTLGTAGLIIAGLASTGSSSTWVTRLLSVRALVWVGGLSYPLYLWHWPMLVGAEWIFGSLSTGMKLLIVVAAVGPAYVSKRWIEDPVRRSRVLARAPRKVLAGGALIIAMGVGAGALTAATQPGTTSPSPTPPAITLEPPATPSPMPSPAPLPSVVATPAAEGETFVPQPADAKADRPIAYELGCQAQKADTEPAICDIGDMDSDFRAVLVGDSKILQWYDAVDAIGKSRGWHFQTMTKTWCSFMDAPTTYLPHDSHYPECDTWNENVVQTLLADPPDVVITSGYQHLAYESDRSDTLSTDAAIAGLVKRWQQLEDAGIEVIVVYDNPTPPLGMTVYECVQDHLANWHACAFNREEGIARSGAAAQRPAVEDTGVTAIDMTLAICPEPMCQPIVNNVLVYRDTSHLTVTYVLTLTQLLAQQLDAVLDDRESP